MRKLALMYLLGNVLWMTACGSGNNSSGGGNNPPPPPVTNNVQAIIVDAGPLPQTFFAVNEPFTTVTVCVPGTSTCQSIDHVLVDTGSQGLRILSSVLTVSLPQTNNTTGNLLAECLPFADGYVWGPLATADITMAGEKASSTPVQIVIPSTSSPMVPQACDDQNPPGGNGNEGQDVSTFGANGIIGVGLFLQDCGPACTTQNQNIPDRYFDCPPSGCTHTYVTLDQQVQNPVGKFATDNNGVLIQLPAIASAGAANVSGSMIFGIGTQSNNGLGSANVYATDDVGNITSIYKGTSYSGSFLDSGSNGLFLPDSSIPTCASPNDSWYCPANPPLQLSAQNQGTNMNNPITVNFTIDSANNLFNSNNTAFSTLGGPVPANLGSVDFGLSFFYGRNVFTALENKTISGTNVPGPFFAY